MMTSKILIAFQPQVGLWWFTVLDSGLEWFVVVQNGKKTWFESPSR
jgi:hypothetical protein